MRITKNDNHDLGFVLWCFASEAITKEEFREWVMHVIEIVEVPPQYIFELIDFDGYLVDLHKTIGFTPDWSPTKKEQNAISGIAIRRGVEAYEHVDTEKCIEALRQSESISDQFSKLFPFIKIDCQQGSGGNA